ncbi:hypothetical protein [Citricoccus alkalitolerans]|uniref:Uncharacterized protein n=1 Tax=Citricoccus alkalitolerans TaxID=246603 RepID=A0ABV8XZL4_9MICC
MVSGPPRRTPEPGGDPGEAVLVGWLRDDLGWIPGLSLSWGDYFQVRTLTAYEGHTGHFEYAELLDRL